MQFFSKFIRMFALTKLNFEIMSEIKYVVTIGRQFGSGGREIGKLVANKLGIKYYDKELLTEASKNTGVCKEFFENADERSPNFLSSIFSFNFGFNGQSYFTGSSPISDDSIYNAQSMVMKELANRSSCVIVGRSADYVLRKHPCCINIFLHASMEARVKRIISRNDCKSKEEAEQLAVKKNKLRASYYNFYTDKEWGDAASYDFSIDSSSLSTEEVADLIISYVKLRVANHAAKQGK